MATSSTICITAGRKPGGYRSGAAPVFGGAALGLSGKSAVAEAADSSGILRGLGWGLLIEGTGLLLLYGLWHVALILRP